MPASEVEGGSAEGALEALSACGIDGAGWEARPVVDKAKSQVYRLTNHGSPALIAKRALASTASVESAVYTSILPRLPVSTVRLVGRYEEPGGAWIWLLLEEAEGDPYAHYEAEHGSRVGGWLARLHGAASELDEVRSLPDRGPAYFRARLAAAHRVLERRLGEVERSDERDELARAAHQLEVLMSRWPELEEFSSRIPPSLVHGDLTHMNVRVGRRPETVYAFDWEMAGLGIGAVDFIRSIDLDRYWAGIRAFWPAMTASDVARLDRYAKILRPLTHEWARKPTAKIAAYREHMDEAMRALGWTKPRRRPQIDASAAQALSRYANLDRWERDRARRKAARSRFPARGALESGLTSALGLTVEVVGREPNVWRSTFPSEIVDCLLTDGRHLRLLCKYGLTAKHEAFGHRAGAGYEAAVYERVLGPAGFRPACLGSHEVAPGETWLALEYLDGAGRLDRTDADPLEVMTAAASWAARFHAAGARRIGEAALAFLNRYEGDYYAGWARRAEAFSAPLHRRQPWLPKLCERIDEIVLPLLRGGYTVVHGEYTVHNVLWLGGLVFPIDWESAALAPGEVDLASLLEGWDRASARAIEDAYVAVRWGGDVPDDARERLVAAKVYWALRWLGERPDWTLGEKNAPRYPRLYEIAEEAGLL